MKNRLTRSTDEFFQFNGHDFEIRLNLKKNRTEIRLVDRKGFKPVFYHPASGKSLSRMSAKEREFFKEGAITRFRSQALQAINPEKLHEYLTEELNEIGPSLSRIAARWKTVHSHQSNIIQRVALKTLKNLERLRDEIHNELDILALPARNLHELFLWIHYVIKHPGGLEDKEKGVISLALFDQRELNQGIMDLMETPTDRIKEIFAERQQLLIEEAEQLEVIIPDKKKHPTTRRLAELVDCFMEDSNQTEVRMYNSFYKLTSKVLHPSPYALVYSPSEFVELNFRQKMALRGARYARKIQKILWDATRRT